MSNYIRQIQADLKQAGLYTGEIDGIAGKLTVQAVAQAIAKGVSTPNMEQAVAEQHRSDPELVETITQDEVKASDFVFSDTSISRLNGVNDNLVKVVKRALELSTQDFAVLEGLRTKERQAELVRKGASQTMNSKHITGRAVDLVPIVDGKVSWDWKYFYPIAEAVRKAAKELGVQVKWGGAWDDILNTTTVPTTKLVENYVATRRRQGRKAFTDGPHFELV